MCVPRKRGASLNQAFPQHQAARNRTEPNGTERNRTERNRTERSGTEPVPPERKGTIPNRTEPSRAEPDRTEPNRTEPNRPDPTRTEKIVESKGTERHQPELTKLPREAFCRTAPDALFLPAATLVEKKRSDRLLTNFQNGTPSFEDNIPGTNPLGTNCMYCS